MCGFRYPSTSEIAVRKFWWWDNSEKKTKKNNNSSSNKGDSKRHVQGWPAYELITANQKTSVLEAVWHKFIHSSSSAPFISHFF